MERPDFFSVKQNNSHHRTYNYCIGQCQRRRYQEQWSVKFPKKTNPAETYIYVAKNKKELIDFRDIIK
jgi:hypothetical protein